MSNEDLTTQLKNKHILLVDDNRISVQYYLETLENYGAQVSFVDNLQDALTCINTEPTLDFILIDLNMPTGSPPNELRDLLPKLGDSQGQSLGQYLINIHKNIPYRYLSVVPQVFKPFNNESKELLWDKTKFPPEKLAKNIVLALQS